MFNISQSVNLEETGAEFVVGCSGKLEFSTENAMKRLFVLSLATALLAACGNVARAADLSGTITYPGSQTGLVRVTASQSFSGNKVLKLSGAGTVRIASLTSLAGPELSIQFWFKGATVQSAVRQQSSGYIIAGWNGGHLTSADGALAGAVNGVTDGNWHHVIMTRKRNGTLAGYVDGALKASTPVGNTDLPNVNGPVYFGSLANLGEYTIGELDEIALWNRALSASEIATNWSSALATNATGLVGYWKFDDDTFNDSTATAYVGTPIGDAAIVSDDIPIYSQTIVVAAPGAYTIPGVPLGGGFAVTAFRDVNGDTLKQFGEPSGAYAGNPFTVSGNQAGVNLTLTEPPYITQQPQAPPGNRVVAGGNVSFSVTALGTPTLTYQWYRDAVALANDAHISGATSPNLQLTGLVPGDAGGYACVVANAQGSVASKAPQLYVITDPKSISGSFTYTGSQTGLVHTTVLQLRTNKVLNLANTATNYAATTLTDLSGDELSIEYWFQGTRVSSAVRQQGGPGYIVAGWGANLHILGNDGGTAGVKVSNPTTTVTDGNWHHVAMSWKRNTVNGFASYLDGELVEQRNSADAAVPNIGAQVFFGSFTGTAEFTHGLLDEIAIWGKALTRSEIRSHARDGLTGSEPGLKGYWNFDDGLGQDLTPNGNNAELHAGATISDASIPGQGALYADVFAGVGPYSIAGIPAGSGYSLYAFLDANGNGSQDANEARGGYAGNPFNLAASLAGADVTLYEPPSILTNPVSVAVLEGGAIRLSVVAGGTSNTFQWRHYATPLVNGGRVTGATSTSLAIAGAQLADAGAYSVVVNNPQGTATSQPAGVAVQPASVTNALVAYWKFDETVGTTAAESTGLSSAASLYNFPLDDSQWLPGRIVGALNFGDPTNQNYVLAPDYAKPTNTIAVSAWVWADSRPSWASIAKNWGNTQPGQFHLGLNSGTGELHNQMTDGGGNVVAALDTTPLPMGSWQHVAFSADGARMRLYRNGVQVAESATYDGTLLAPPMAGLGLGVKTDDSGTVPDTGAPGYWHGRLDDVGIWGRALTPDEIFGIYQAGLAGRSLAQATAVRQIVLTIGQSGTAITVHYEAGTLEWAAGLAGPWTSVPGATPPAFSTNSSAALKFFRVR